jgi:hypothetical protein
MQAMRALVADALSMSSVSDAWIETEGCNRLKSALGLQPGFRFDNGDYCTATLTNDTAELSHMGMEPKVARALDKRVCRNREKYHRKATWALCATAIVAKHR